MFEKMLFPSLCLGALYPLDLSHPASYSINDGIPKDLRSLTYITVGTAIKHITISKIGHKERLPPPPSTSS